VIDVQHEGRDPAERAIVFKWEDPLPAKHGDLRLLGGGDLDLRFGVLGMPQPKPCGNDKSNPSLSPIDHEFNGIATDHGPFLARRRFAQPAQRVHVADPPHLDALSTRRLRQDSTRIREDLCNCRQRFADHNR